MKRISYCSLIIVFFITAFGCSQRMVPTELSGKKGKEYDSAAFEYIFVEAVKQKLMGNAGEALKHLEVCMKINPESGAVYYQIAQILAAGGDISNSKKYGIKAVEKDPGNLWYLMSLGGVYYRSNNLDSAIIFYEKAVNRFPEKEDIQLTLGKLYSENKNYGKAEEMFEKLNTKYGINEGSTLASIRNFMEYGNWDKALELALRLSRENPEEILYTGLLAEIYRGKGDEVRAMEVYKELMERNPESGETQLSLCQFLISQKKYEELLQLLNTVILNNNISREDKLTLFAGIFEVPEMVNSHGVKLTLALMILEATYEKDGIIMLLRPELLEKMGKYDEAAIRLEEIIKEEPENYFAWERLLLAYFNGGNFKKLQERGADCSLKFNRSFLAKVLYATGATENTDYNTALEELRKAEILAGNENELIMQVLSIRADVYYRMKDFGMAFETFDKALEKKKDDYTILNNYAYYLAEQNMRLKEAEEMSEEVIKNEVNNTTFLDTYGWVLYKRGKVREAKKVFEQIIGSGETPDAVWYEHYGYVLKKKRDCEGAIKQWNMALKIDNTKADLLEEIRNCGR